MRHDTGGGPGARRGWAVAALLAVAMVAAACASPIVGAGPSGGRSGGSGSADAPSAPAVPLRCEDPAAGAREQLADPDQVALDADALTEAISYASAKGAQSVRVYRHGCLVGRSWNDPAVERTPMPAWSMTKGVVATVVGVAATQGHLDVDDPIGVHLDGLSDQHGAITVRHLLTQTSGLRFAWLNDLQDASEFDSVARLLRRPFEAEPGEQYVYAQTTVTALVAVVEAAVGEEFQSYVTRELFEPLGIPRSEWRWDRDRAGRTHGFAFLDMSPRSFARLGLMLGNEGEWRGQRLVDADFIRQGRAGTDANPAYGFLWFTNAGERRPLSNFSTDEWIEGRRTPAAPDDTFGLSGLFEQTVYVIPSLDMVVVRMGLPHQLFYDPIGQVRARNPDWDHRFFQILMRGVTDVDVPDPGEWVPEPDAEVDLRYIIGFDLL